MKQKYIEGDVVMYNGKIMVVDEPSDSYHFDLINPRDCTICLNVEIEKIKPAPLISFSLEQNGWELSHEFYKSPNKEGETVCLTSKDGFSWKAYIGRQQLRKNINSLPDLQHLLFGLGLNHEMEV